MKVFTREWWDAAGARAANTAIAVVTPYLALLVTGAATPQTAASAAGLAAVASFLTSLFGLPEVGGDTVSLGKAVLFRSLKTFGQSAAVWIGASTLFSQLDWSQFGILVGVPVGITILRTLKSYLPETVPVVVADATKVLPAAEITTPSGGAA